jgi:hypothetical protein
LFYNARALELKPVISVILRETAQVEKIILNQYFSDQDLATRGVLSTTGWHQLRDSSINGREVMFTKPVPIK